METTTARSPPPDVAVLVASSVRSIRVGPDVDWSTGFGAKLERVEEPYVLVLLEDYLF